MNTGIKSTEQVENREDEGSNQTARRTAALEDAAYARRVRAWYKDAYSKTRESRDQQSEDIRFYAGHQWDIDQINERRAQGRPTLTLNYVLPIVNAVVGEERLNRQQITVYGRDGDLQDDAGAYAFTEIIRWIMDGCNGDYAVSKAFRSTVICGEGWLEVRVNYLDDIQGKIEVVPVKHEEIYVDPLSEQEDLSDARYLIRERWLPEDAIEAMWPGTSDKLKLWKETHEGGYLTENTPRGDAYTKADQVYNPKEGTWQVLEVWHYEILAGGLALNPDTGQIEELTAPELDRLEADNQAKLQEYETLSAIALATGSTFDAPPPAPLQSVRRPVKMFYRGFVCGDMVLERGETPHRRLKRFPYIPIFGMRDDEKGYWFGVVRPIKDAQRQHNVEQSTILHWTQTMPKGGWMAPRGAFVDRQKWEQRSSQPGFIGEYNPSRGKPEEIRPPTLPRHMVELMPTRLQAMRDISGVNVDLMGSGVKDTPGVVMEMRRKQALTVLQTLFDNLRLSRRILGEVLICFIQQYISDDRKIRVVGERGAHYVLAARDYAFKTYDAVIEDSPDSPTDKMATMHILQTTLPMLMKAGIPVPPSFVDLLPISPHIRDEWKQMLMAPPPAPEPTPNGPPIPQ